MFTASRKKLSPGNNSKRLSARFDEPDGEPLLEAAPPSLSAVLSTEGVCLQAIAQPIPVGYAGVPPWRLNGLCAANGGALIVCATDRLIRLDAICDV